MGSMAARRILQLGDPLLRQVSRPVPEPASAVAVLADLADTLAAFRREHGFGRGISAIQIGQPVRVIFLNVEGSDHELINPEFVDRSSETFELWDDCFSFPGLMVRVRRHQSVTIRFQNRLGALQTLVAQGAMSELIQHEMDHLDGILAVDRAIDRDSLSTREEYFRRQALAGGETLVRQGPA
jgi:peptide deformylase